jgi:SAM-dependent methyltransferase
VSTLQRGTGHAYEATFLDELSGKPRDRQLLAEFAARVGDPVIEIGSGPGQIGAFVREHGRRVVGVDLSARMAALAGRRLDASVCADMRSIPIGSGNAGGLVAFYSLIHLPRSALPATMREFRRVLRRGGRVLVSVHEGTVTSCATSSSASRCRSRRRCSNSTSCSLRARAPSSR